MRWSPCIDHFQSVTFCLQINHLSFGPKNFLKKLTIKLKQKCKGTRIAKSTLFSFKVGELEIKTAFAINIESAKAIEWETNSVTYCSEQFDK